jgi:flagellar P-ring protein precursor FlgI
MSRQQGARETRGTPTTGAVPNGARVERELAYDFNQRDHLTLALRSPDFTTAARIEDVINGRVGSPIAFMRDPGTVELNFASLQVSPARLLADIENLTVPVNAPARIVIDENPAPS